MDLGPTFCLALTLPRRLAIGTFPESRDLLTCKSRYPHQHRIIMRKLSAQPVLQPKPRGSRLRLHRPHC